MQQKGYTKKKSIMCEWASKISVRHFPYFHDVIFQKNKVYFFPFAGNQ